MGGAANQLGSLQAAEELGRAGWAYAVAIDHRPLMGRLRSELADIAHWNPHSRDLNGPFARKTPLLLIATCVNQLGCDPLLIGPRRSPPARRTGKRSACHRIGLCAKWQ